MKKTKIRLISLAFMLAMITVFACNAFAASKPAVELMYFTFSMDSVGGVSPTLYFRNNSEKTIKYLDWYITAYNRVGDPAPDEFSGRATQCVRMIGPISTFPLIRSSSSSLSGLYTVSEDSPFAKYKVTGYLIDHNGELKDVYQDENDNFFIRPALYDANTFIYLTEDEIQNAMFCDYCSFNYIWYNKVISRLVVDKVVVTYMDGTTQTIKEMGSSYRNAPLQSIPFMQQLEQYASIYNYNDYVAFNPDLRDTFGTNQKLYFEHFISTGMDEGRQGSKEFNLVAYKENNPDLVAMFGEDNQKYYEHYLASGKSEGRKAA